MAFRNSPGSFRNSADTEILGRPTRHRVGCILEEEEEEGFRRRSLAA